MSFSINFPLFLIVLALATAVVNSLLKRDVARAVTLGLTAVSTICNGILFIYILNLGETVTYLMGHYPHPWGNELRISPIESLVSMVFSVVLFLTVLGGKLQINNRIQVQKGQYFYTMVNLIQSALLVLVYTNDIFTGYVFIEICTLSSCGILMIRENGRTILASVRYMIFSLIGSGLFLFGVIFLYNITGDLLMPNLKADIFSLWESNTYRLPLLMSIGLITIGISIKSGLFPFHHWMADTYGAAVPASSGILSGLVSKGYIFFLIKIIFDVFGKEIFYASGVNNVVYALGVLGIIVGSIGAMREDNIFRMTAYSSAAQIGYIYMGIGLTPTLGIIAALFQVLTHALTKPALFLSVAQLSDPMGHKKKFAHLQGAGYVNKSAGVFFTVLSLSMIGLPLTMGFMSKYLFAAAAFENAHNKMVPTLIALAISTVLNTIYFAKTIIRIYTIPGRGTAKEAVKTLAMNQTEIKPTTIGMQKAYFIATFVFVTANIVLGIFSKPIIDLLENVLTLF